MAKMNAVWMISILSLVIIFGIKKFNSVLRELFFEDEGYPTHLRPVKIKKD